MWVSWDPEGICDEQIALSVGYVRPNQNLQKEFISRTLMLIYVRETVD